MFLAAPCPKKRSALLKKLRFLNKLNPKIMLVVLEVAVLFAAILLPLIPKKSLKTK